MNVRLARRALLALGYENASIEMDGTYWTGTDYERTYIDPKKVEKKMDELVAADEAARESAVAKLTALGLTDAEIAALRI